MQLHSKIIGEGIPFLILHGLFGTGDNWKTLGKRFSALGFQVHLIDQRNHGRSPHSDDFSYDFMVEDLKAYCDEHGFKQVCLLGHSMGGKTAMHFAVKYPELVKAMVVVDIAPKYYPPHHQTILAGLTMLYNENLTSRREADEKLEAYIEEWSVRQFLLKNLYWKEKGKLALRMNFPVIKEKIDQVGGAIAEQERYNGSTLFIKGENSNYIQLEDKSLLEQHFPNSRLEIIKGTDHWVHAEEPEVFYQLVTSFLNEQK